MDLLGNTGNTKNLTIYKCETCNVITSHKNNFNKHCQTLKHRQSQIGNTMEIPEIPKSTNAHNCAPCKLQFVTYSGLWKHQKKCPFFSKNGSNYVHEALLLENKELRSDMRQMLETNNEMIKTNHDLQRMVVELCKNTHPTLQSNDNRGVITTGDNNNTTINSNNKTFNLQFFLKETCKDALNLTEFIQYMKTSSDDIERIGSVGYVEGTSEFIIKHLNELGVERRPIQCTDAKRQTLYIKENNEWTKEDDSFRHMQFLVDSTQKMNLTQLPEWRKNHPNCLTSRSVYTDSYNIISHELMGGDCNKIKLHVKDQRIFNKIIKETVIDKTNYLT